MTELDAAADRFAHDLRTAGASPAEATHLRALYAAALAERSDRTWHALYIAALEALATIEPAGEEALAAYARLAALAADDLGATLLTPQAAERMRSRLVEAA